MKLIIVLSIVSILIGIIVFHILILIQLLPSNLVWGGRISSRSELIRKELIAVFVLLGLVFFTSVDLHWIPLNWSKTPFSIGYSTMAAFFVLNTLGNLKSTSSFEKRVFTPITILLSLLSIGAVILL